MLSCQYNETFWGELPSADMAHVQEWLGVEKVAGDLEFSKIECRREVEGMSQFGTLNARQACEAVKGPFAEGIDPTFYSNIQDDPEEDADIYTDGGVHHPHVRWMAFAGMGIWTPKTQDLR